MNSRKKRFKLYKSGKQWITAAIVSIGFIAGTQVKHVHADTTNNNQIQTTQTQSTAESNASQSVTLTIANNENSNSASASVASAQAAATKQNRNINAATSFAQSKVAVNNVTSQATASSQSNITNTASDSGNQASDIAAQSDAKKTGWQKVNDNWHYIKEDGTAQTGWYKSPAGWWYYFNNDGQSRTGWQNINNKWYHFDEVNASADTGWYQSAASFWYYLDPENAWAHTGWYKSAAGFWYYFDQNSASGLRGWQSIDGRWYYFDWNNASGLRDWQYINNRWYHFNWDNAWADTGWQKINGKTYTFNFDGSWADGWDWPFPQDGEGYFGGGQLFGVHAGGEFRLNGFHDGLDFGSIDHPGREVHAIHGGTVKIVGYGSGLSWYAVVDTGEYLVVYQEAFSSKNNILVHEGQQISTGDVIGIRDTSHVHIGITRDHNFNRALASSFINNGTWLDPQKIIREGL